MVNIRIYSYNNYYNRMVKKLTTESPEFSEYIYQLLNVKAFNPNDGVNTEHIFGDSSNQYGGIGDYLLILDEYNDIISRWFIIDHERLRNGQWKVLLRRDLIVDYYDEIIDSDVYIEKAILNDEDTLIFNNEQLSLNEIKTSQELLKDRSESAWLVGYLSAKQNEDIEIEASKVMDYDIAINNLSEWELYNYSNFAAPGQKKQGYTNLGTPNLSIRIAYAKQGFAESDIYTFNLSTNSAYVKKDDYIDTTNFELHYKDTSTANRTYIKNTINDNCQTYKNQITNILKNNFDTFDYINLFNEYNGKIIYDITTEKYYTIHIISGASNKLEYIPEVSSKQDSDLVDYTLGEVYSVDYNAPRVDYYLEGGLIGRPQNLFTSSTSAYKLTITSHLLEVDLEEVESANTSTKIKTSAKQLKDAPYKMFCMPYKLDSDFNFLYQKITYSMNRDTSMSVMNKLISQLSGANVLYDAQILPYCPCLDLIDDLGQFNLSTLINGEPLQEDIDFTLIKDTNTNNIEGFLVYCNKASFPVVIDKTIAIDNVKISNECDKYRICSPNFNSAFEFNAAKNKGILGFNVSCTYKPYQPYIKVAPIFNGLYGGSFKDPRGLICGGEFALPLSSNQWSTYEINNKNYLNSFNRQIENMEVQQKYQRVSDITNAITGSITGAVSGAFSGSVMTGGSPAGAIAGSAIGGIASAAGGIGDVIIKEKLRSEAIDYTKDQFNYSIQNIQALPYSLSRVGSLTNDNTIYPVLEFYTCSQREKVALANKIAYNSMTVMVIDKIKNYIDNSWSYNYVDENGINQTITSKGYIKGKLIRLESIDDDFHIINSISGELNKGVFI